MRFLILIFLSFGYNQDNCCDVQVATDCYVPGAYCPQCTNDCEWEPMQCNGSVPACWCVDSKGIMIDDTYTYPTWSEGYPNCEEDCNGEFGGDAIVDECGVCSGDGTSCYQFSNDDGIPEDYLTNTGSGNYNLVFLSILSCGIIDEFVWHQEESGGSFYLKIFEDNNGVPGNEIYSQVIAGGIYSGWNSYSISGNLDECTNYWIGNKNFSTTGSFGIDMTNNLGYSYYSVDSSDQEWIEIDGNLMFRLNYSPIFDCSCFENSGSGDINDDGIINVLDIIALVTFVLEGQYIFECDLIQDGVLNVLDIVSLVNIILGEEG